MSYRLRLDRAQQLVMDSLPQPVSEQLTLALARVCDDPLGETSPYDGDGDEVMRLLVIPAAVTVLLVLDGIKIVRVLQISYHG